MVEFLVGAIDQGTSSTRFVVYNEAGDIVASHQKAFDSITPEEGWVEQDPSLIVRDTIECMEACAQQLQDKDIPPSAVKAIGIANQRETSVVWDKITGQPLHNAIVWLDTRTADLVEELKQLASDKAEAFRRRCGLPFSTYFSALKLKWMLDNVSHIRDEADAGRCLFGTIDSWLIWNLTGGSKGGVHATDVTNASRTMLMNLSTLQWDTELVSFFDVPETMLPEIRSSSEIFGQMAVGPFKGAPISGCLGDQQAAMVGQMCFNRGEAKNTYGTGCFLLSVVGDQPAFSSQGLLSTVAFKLGKNAECMYALEGSIAIAGAAIKWLRDNLGIIKESSEVETLARQVDGTHGVYFVPAFSGLLAPYWRHDARGTIVGLSQYSNSKHLARATLEAVCFQTREVLEAMTKDCGLALTKLKVDGGMTQNKLLLQLQADLLGVPVVKPRNAETTSWGAAIAAATAENVEVFSWTRLKEHTLTVAEEYRPSVSVDDRDVRYQDWKRAVSRSLGWVRSKQQARPSVPPSAPSFRWIRVVQVASAIAIGASLAYVARLRWQNRS